MAKNIEMQVLGSNGSYEILYPVTDQSLVINLLNEDTKTFLGLESTATADDAFRYIYTSVNLQGKALIHLTVQTSGGNPLSNIVVTSEQFCDIKGNPIDSYTTGSDGKVDVFVDESTGNLTIDNYGDIETITVPFSVSLTEISSQTITVNIRNFVLYNSTTNIRFSDNVNQIDVTVVGGGGGGGAAGGGSTSNRTEPGCGGGGGGGYCVVQEKVSFNKNENYLVTVGSGGTSNNNGGQSNFLTLNASGGNGGVKGNDDASGGGGAGNGYGGHGAYDVRGTGTNGGNGSVNGYSSFTEVTLYGGGGAGGGGRWREDTAIGGLNYGGKAGQNATGYGGGGGGGNWDISGSSYSRGNGGRGYSGCVAIRMYLNVTT